MPNRSRGRQLSTKDKGLTGEHRTNRDRMVARHVNGKPCWWCGKPMYREPNRNWDGHALEADHSKKRAIYGNHNNRADRLLHKTCNIQRNTTPDDERPALMLVAQQTTTTDDPNDLGPLAMGWPWPTTEAT